MSAFEHDLRPNWPAPTQVQAYTTTRNGGVSLGTYASLNLSLRGGDTPQAVAANRARLHHRLNLPQEPCWLEQVHGQRLLAAHELPADRQADASWTDQLGYVCTILTADCLPVLLCAEDGRCVAAAHAGWRGLVGGVLEATVRGLPTPPQQLLAWLGPAIGPQAYEVGAEVRAAFVNHDPAAAYAFNATRPGHWRCDLYALARQRLVALGVQRIYGGEYCTYHEATRFYSYRRDGLSSGRMASLIWLTP